MGVTCWRATNSAFPSRARHTWCSPVVSANSLACKCRIDASVDTCWGLAVDNSIGYSDFLTFNPSVNNDCSNLLSGTNVCISQPGPIWNGTAISGATVTKTNEYATATAAIPTNAAPGSTRKCGKWYSIQYGDYCQLVAVNNSIALGLFEAINPSVNSTCGNLETGIAYCVWPTADWNSTNTGTPVSAPTTTPSGTTDNCFQWHIIQKGDGCYT